MSRSWNWWIPAEGITREVIQVDIQRYLGPDAVCKPGVGTGQYQGVPGYYISAYRNFTPAMIQDLKADSANWHRERRRGDNNDRYEHSEVHRSRQFWGPTSEPQQQTGLTAPSTGQQYSYAQQTPSYTQQQQSSAYAQTQPPSHSQQQQQQPSSYSGGSVSYAPSAGYDNRHTSTPSAYLQQGQASTSYPHYQGYQQQQAPTQSPSQNYSYTTSGAAYGGQQNQQANQQAYQPTAEAPRGYQQQAQYGPGQTSQGQTPSTQSQQVRPGYYLASDGRQYPYPSTSQ